MQIAVFGLGYVGSTNIACLSKLGHSIIGVDVNETKVAKIAAGQSPIVEPMVPDLIAQGHAAGRVRGTSSAEIALENADAAIVCVGTPSQADGATDQRFLTRVTQQIADVRKKLDRAVPIFVRSTSFPSVHRTLIAILQTTIGGSHPIAYCVHPEFLREGQAVDDFFYPPKIIYGITDDAVRRSIEKLYPGIDAPTEIMSPDAAALVKYADNSFHAVKITFANEMGRLASSFGVDAREIMRVFCLDTKLNISPQYLRPGLPFGGSCLPKDLRAINAWSRERHMPLPMLDQVMHSNAVQAAAVVERLAACGANKIGLFGLAFKDDTDDLRESPMLTMVEMLLAKGIDCRVFDPLVDRAMLQAAVLGKPGLSDFSSWMADDGHALIAAVDLVVIARKKVGIDFKSVNWPTHVKVFDLVGVDLPLEPERVIGLYW